MKQSVARLLVIVGVTLALPAAGRAQEVTVSGTVSDSTGGVLPGVTVNATHEASGNTFTGVTDGHGSYRIPLRTGFYALSVELSGFATITNRVELVLGQQAVLNFKMSPAAVRESVTVTGQAPLLDVARSNLSSNIDTRQMQEIPINGRNWMQLTLLAAGSRANGAREDAPADREYGAAVYQFNIDGQQVSENQGQSQSGEPRFSRDAIGEFEVSTNRFDATLGRSSGVVVNAVTKSGTNLFSGTSSGFFRSSGFKGADFVANRVLPYSDQQYSETFGGPIAKDKAHFFVYVEAEREPQTQVFGTPYRSFNIADLTSTRKERKGGGRFDLQFSTSTHLMARANHWIHDEPFADRCVPSATTHPSILCGQKHSSDQLFVSLTKTIGQQAVNEIKVGYNSLEWGVDQNGINGTFNPQPYGCDAKARSLAASGVVPGLLIPNDGDPPGILLRGFSLGTTTSVPHCVGEDTYQIRDNFSYSFRGAGRHQLRVGAEYLRTMNHLWYPNFAHGQIDASNGPIPPNIEAIFPVWNDWTTWNLAALSPITRFYRKSFAQTNTMYDPIDTSAAWLQDDWVVTDHLTVNAGLRYDVSLGSIGDRLPAFQPFVPQKIEPDLMNLAPRFGFAYVLNTRTVIRGGWGKYYAQPLDFQVYFAKIGIETVVPSAVNDGRPNFAADPYNGQILTYNSIIASGIRRDVAQALLDPNTYHTMRSYQTTIGFQRQIGQNMSVQADYADTRSRGEGFITRNANLSYNPATGANYPFTDLSHLRYPNWGLVPMTYGDGYSNYRALQTAFTKRFSDRWQASANYTLSAFWDAAGAPNVGFPVAPDIGGEYTLGVGDQRHRATFNGIWDLGHGFQASGLYFFGSGLRYATNYGGDLRQMGVGSTGRLRPDGTIVPRNDFVGQPVQRVDVRFQKRIPIRGRLAVDAIVEVFNLFNHTNYGTYTTAESSPAYGQPSSNKLQPFQPRMGQFAFRLAF